MLTLNILLPFPVALLLFLISLVIVMVASAWFTRRLEALCELFGLSISLARTGEAAASVEEIFSSNSINAALGVALPLVFWQGVLHDRSILFLDMPLTILLTLGMFAGVFRRRMSSTFGVVLLCIYAAWVIVHVWI